MSSSSPSPSSSSSSVLEIEIEESIALIPGLPNDVAVLILSFIPYSHYSRLKPTCKSWRLILSSKTLISLRQNNRPSHLLCIFPQDPSIASPYLFDPQTLAWAPLPPTPCNPHSYGLCNFSTLSIGPHVYVLGGSLFDTRSFPIDRPSPSSSTLRFDIITKSWESLAPMIYPRGSFGCALVSKDKDSKKEILVAGGGSRHTVFGAAGTRTSAVERYDVERNEWVELERMPGLRAGCVGFCVGSGEFWVIGGYGEAGTISGLFPVDELCRDAVVMELNNGGKGKGKWREVGDTWGAGERVRSGKIVVLDDQRNRSVSSPSVFMLDGNDILRYDRALNRWREESHVPKKAPYNSSFGFVALNGELHVMTLMNAGDSTETRRSRNHKRAGSLYIQIYHPKKKTWRSLITKSPFSFSCPLDFNFAVMCSICL